MKEKTITIILPTFNSESYIEECIKSVDENTDENTEVIIVDGGSTDNTINIIDKFKSSKISYLSQPDFGIYDALNKGIKIANGRWLYFLGADDRLLPDFKTLVSKLQRDDTIYYGNPALYYEYGQLADYSCSGRFSKYRITKDCINHQAIIYPYRVFESNLYDLRYKVHADYHLNLKLWGNRKYKKKHFPLTIVRYNMNGFSSKNNDPFFKDKKAMIVRETLGFFFYLFYLWFRHKNRKSGFTDYY